MRAMTALRRHQLAWLGESGWATVLARAWDAQARDGLSHWAAHRLPLVVTRQAKDSANDGPVALGLPAPGRWGRRRFSLQVPLRELVMFGEFPHLGQVLGLLPLSARRPMRHLSDELDRHEATARAFGSYGWQAISGCDHVRPASDLDLAIKVDGVAHADAVAELLRCFRVAAPRLDGELVFGNGTAVAWREWSAWRSGRTQAVLVKHLDGVSLQRDTRWCEHRGRVVLPS